VASPGKTRHSATRHAGERAAQQSAAVERMGSRMASHCLLLTR
jgi:hypothetical protein